VRNVSDLACKNVLIIVRVICTASGISMGKLPEQKSEFRINECNRVTSKPRPCSPPLQGLAAVLPHKFLNNVSRLKSLWVIDVSKLCRKYWAMLMADYFSCLPSWFMKNS